MAHVQTSYQPISLALNLRETHVLVTGGGGLIGSAVVNAFLTTGANVSSLDISHPVENGKVSNNHEGSKGSLLKIQADITSPESMNNAWSQATQAFGTVETCIALASLDLSVLPETDSIVDADPAVWKRVFEVNVGGTMLTSQFWLRGIRDHVSRPDTQSTPSSHKPLCNTSLVIIGSEAGHFGVRTCAAYSASKSAVQYGLLQSLRADAPRIYASARVNAVAPGPVDTVKFREETGGPGTKDWWREAEATVALRKPVPIEAVARTIVYLASDQWSGNVHGQTVNVDSGKMGALMWHPDEVPKNL